MSLFKDMYSLVKKDTKKLRTNRIAAVREPAPILPADKLLSTEKRKQIMDDIRTLLNLSEEEYQQFFLAAAENFACFVQNLPETDRSYYAGIGGMLEHGLERASLSLFLCSTYLLPKDAALSSISQQEMLWIYAVYTAALFYDLGKIAVSHEITLLDQDGNTLKPWLPYAGTMEQHHEAAAQYVCGFNEEAYNDTLRWRVTPLLARQILPESGFHLIASDPDVLEAWLALLSDEHRQVGSFLSVIPLADAQILESYFTDKKIFRHNLPPQTIALLSKLEKERKAFLAAQKELREKMLSAQQPADEPQQQQPQSKTAQQSLFGLPAIPQNDSKALQHDAKEITQRFIQWVQQESRQQKTTQAHIQRTEHGMLLDNKLLDKFMTDNKIMQLSSAELKKLLAETQIAMPVSYYAAHAPHQVHSALLVHNPYLIMPAGGFPPIAQVVIQAAYPLQQPLIEKSPAPTPVLSIAGMTG